MDDYSNLLGIDTETLGIEGQAYCVSAATMAREEEGWELGWVKCWLAKVDPHKHTVMWNPTDIAEITAALKGRIPVGHNLGLFDRQKLIDIGIPSERFLVHHDTLPMSHIWNSEEPHDAKYLSQRYLEISNADELEILSLTRECRALVRSARTYLGKETRSGIPATSPLYSWIQENRDRFSDELSAVKFLSQCRITEGKGGLGPVKGDMWLPAALGVGDCTKYAKQDAVRHIALGIFYLTKLSENNLLTHYKERMDEHVPIRAMQKRGIALREEACQSKIKELSTITNACEGWATARGYNLRSPQQVAKKLFTELRLPFLKSGKLHPSTDKDTLLWLRAKVRGGGALHVSNLLTHRKAQKGLDYLAGPSGYLTKSVRDSEGIPILHPRINPTGTGTTRWSTYDPNTQNIPKANENDPDKPDLRECFGPRPGHYLFVVDYSQLELRIMAWISKEWELVEMLNCPKDHPNYRDVHAWNGGNIVKLLGMPDLVGTKVSRNCGKRIVYAMAYGAGDEEIADRSCEELRLPQKSGTDRKAFGRAVKDAFLKPLPRLKRWFYETIEEAKTNGFIRTAYGYPLVSPWRPKERYYASIDHKIQGGAGGIVRRALVACHRYIVQTKEPVYPLLQVHDELDFEVQENVNLYHLHHLCTLMEDNGLVLDGHKLITPVDPFICRTSWSDKEPWDRHCPF